VRVEPQAVCVRGRAAGGDRPRGAGRLKQTRGLVLSPAAAARCVYVSRRKGEVGSVCKNEGSLFRVTHTPNTPTHTLTPPHARAYKKSKRPRRPRTAIFNVTLRLT
jgi:hypothetical protein